MVLAVVDLPTYLNRSIGFLQEVRVPLEALARFSAKTQGSLQVFQNGLRNLGLQVFIFVGKWKFKRVDVGAGRGDGCFYCIELVG